MNKRLLPLAVTACMAISFASCDEDDIVIKSNNTNISITDSDDELVLSTKFNPKKTIQLRNYIKEQLSDDVSVEIIEGDIDATITLRNKDKTVFYLKSVPGKLKIEMDKNSNSKESYHKLKDVCDGVEDVLKN